MYKVFKQLQMSVGFQKNDIVSLWHLSVDENPYGLHGESQDVDGHRQNSRNGKQSKIKVLLWNEIKYLTEQNIIQGNRWYLQYLYHTYATSHWNS